MKNIITLIEEINWEKLNGLIPAIIQNIFTQQVLMLGYMDKAALELTIKTKKVTFYSRTKKRLWTKGESSGNILNLINIHLDCDNDALLIYVEPNGPCCHLNSASCFDFVADTKNNILKKLEQIIKQRYQDRSDNSYTAKLFELGLKRIAQKVGEEGVEVALASITGDVGEIKNEAADLIFHLFVLLRNCGLDFSEVLLELENRALRE